MHATNEARRKPCSSFSLGPGLHNGCFRNGSRSFPSRRHGTQAGTGIANVRGTPRKAARRAIASRRILRRENQELRALNRDLERSVASRTAQLAAANRLKDERVASERKAREEAEVSNRVKSDFLALLSHEFRTPLQAIFGYTELLEREIHGPLTDSQRRDIARIQQSEQHLLGLITAILDFAKLESGQPVDVSLYPPAVHEILLHMEGLRRSLPAVPAEQAEGRDS